jgi:hypothetical protein
MTWFSKDELRKLANLCEDRQFACELIRDGNVDGATYDYAERCFADREACYMKSLSAKLRAVADSGARRVEITI